MYLLTISESHYWGPIRFQPGIAAPMRAPMAAEGRPTARAPAATVPAVELQEDSQNPVASPPRIPTDHYARDSTNQGALASIVLPGPGRRRRRSRARVVDGPSSAASTSESPTMPEYWPIVVPEG